MQHVPAPWISPVLKWAGGKRWLTYSAPELFPKKFNTYYEPFVGGGAVFFSLQPENAVLADANKDLIETYRTIARSPREIGARLATHQADHSSDHYYAIRSSAPTEEVERAARFIYLNRTCYNGLYRVNQQGQFNVPIGTKQTITMPTDDWDVVAGLLAGVSLHVSDFETIIDQAAHGDFVFADPPYTVKHNHNGFVKYNETIFAWADQVRLCAALARAKKRGAKIVCTNADHESIWTLYGKGFNIERVSRASVIGGGLSSRGSTTELVIR